jgi:ribonuclease R
MSRDPHFEREKAQYENPVASREYLTEVLNSHDKPLSFLEICHAVNAKSEMERIGVQRRLRAMEREGQVQFTRQKKYVAAEVEELIRGKVIGHRDGFGFLRPENGDKDLFISAGQMQVLLHDDIVEAHRGGTDRKGRSEARIARVVEPRKEPLVGRYFVEHGVGLVIPDDSRVPFEILIPPENNQGARQGHVVVVEITQRPRRSINPIGNVIEILGEHMAPGMEIEMALRSFDIPHVWPDAVSKQVEKLQPEVDEKAKKNRVDLRSLGLVTIDGEDARDFDDAVYCEPLDNGGWQLWVAIADVSYYVRNGTALDAEAQNRGNSVYFPEQVVPMLPEVLSNGLCSLNPEVDRLCMVCEMTINAQGKISDYQFYEAVMNSKARLTYNKVWSILQGDPKLTQRYDAHVSNLQELYRLYKALKKSRNHRGAIEFETNESKFVFNAQRKIENIVPLERNDAHKLIEECMIAANVCAASLLEEHQVPALYRIHDRPDADRLTTFTSYLGKVGIAHRIHEEAQPADFTEIVAKIQNRPDKELIQTMLLRSMKQAVYEADNIGHFGLALDAYAHFTSPIRRYPDLIVHRVIKSVVAKQAGKRSYSGGKNYTHDEVDQLGEQCSMTERRADDATRDVADWLKCEFMLDHVGDVFEGVVASVTNFGLFIRITEYHIDGLVHITSLENDYYHYDEVKQCLVGESFGKVYRLGDTVLVKVASVNLDERKIDLMLDLPHRERKRNSGKRSVSAKTSKPKGRAERSDKGGAKSQKAGPTGKGRGQKARDSKYSSSKATGKPPGKPAARKGGSKKKKSNAKRRQQ